MLAAIVRFSLRFRGVVIALATVALGYGVYTLLQARYDVFPEFAPPQVQIQTEAPGLSPEQVEALVTQPVENAITGVEGIDTLRSGSIQGISVITWCSDVERRLPRPAVGRRAPRRRGDPVAERYRTPGDHAPDLVHRAPC